MAPDKILRSPATRKRSWVDDFEPILKQHNLNTPAVGIVAMAHGIKIYVLRLAISSRAFLKHKGLEEAIQEAILANHLSNRQTSFGKLALNA